MDSLTAESHEPLTGPDGRAREASPPRLQDVADAVGLHKSTVSLAFSGKGNLSADTREKILRMAREMGYEPNPLAQRLAYGGHSNTIAILSGTLDVGLSTEKILLIQRGLNEHLEHLDVGRAPEVGAGTRGAGNLEVPIYASGGAGDTVQARQIRRQKPRAIVCAASSLSRAALAEVDAYRRGGGIVVSYDVPVEIECDQVIFDREHNAYLAASHLIEQGHRRIGLSLSSTAMRDEAHEVSDSGSLNEVQQGRLTGFRRALQEGGIASRPEWEFLAPSYETGSAALSRRFLAMRDRPNAMCIVNDYVALGFIAEVRRAGLRVPEDVSVVGHGDHPIAAYCSVPLTCASQPTSEIAQAVVETLVERLRGSTVPSYNRTIRGRISIRESVARVAE